MISTQGCITLIDEVKEAASNPDSAYLLRTRIKRALLTASRLAAEAAGVEQPALPGSFTVPANAPIHASTIVELCNRLSVATRQLCQPSEALDTRWQEGWARVVNELDELKTLLRRWPASAHPSVDEPR